ncbi:MAG TPA: ester cyclase [Actinomycetota bacterium]|nr:ester cyclase [Actinomycetota bacterium]
MTKSTGRTAMPRADEDTGQYLARLFEDGFNNEETWRIEQLIADHFLDHGPYVGGADVRQRLETIREVLPDATLHVDEVVRQGDFVATRWTIRGTHAGKTLGIEPTGRRVTLSGMSVERLKDGKVIEHWEFPDLKGFAAQIEADVA